MLEKAKHKIAKELSGNRDLNKKALNLKQSWEEVAQLLKIKSKKK